MLNTELLDRIKQNQRIIDEVEQDADDIPWEVIDIIDAIERLMPPVQIECNDTELLAELLPFFNKEQ